MTSPPMSGIVDLHDGDDHHESLLEEIANAVTHGLGAVAAAIGLGVLIVLAAFRGGVNEMVALVVFGTSMVLLYLASTLYHSASHPRLKAFFHRCDHACIFLLIAGTYTPFSLLVLGGSTGLWLCVAIWSLAIAGALFKVFAHPHRHRRLSVGMYLALGWVGIFALQPIIASMETGGVVLLAAGGLAYTLGVPFYLWRNLPFNHAVWHLFVLAGSACHFAAIAGYALPGVSGAGGVS
jgi:hemolysin III